MDGSNWLSYARNGLFLIDEKIVIIQTDNKVKGKRR